MCWCHPRTLCFSLSINHTMCWCHPCHPYYKDTFLITQTRVTVTMCCILNECVLYIVCDSLHYSVCRTVNTAILRHCGVKLCTYIQNANYCVKPTTLVIAWPRYLVFYSDGLSFRLVDALLSIG